MILPDPCVAALMGAGSCGGVLLEGGDDSGVKGSRDIGLRCRDGGARGAGEVRGGAGVQGWAAASVSGWGWGSYARRWGALEFEGAGGMRA